MKLVAWVIAIGAPLALVSTVSFGGPQLEEKNKPGYPYPGTAAKEQFGAVALQQGTVEDNQHEGAISTDESMAKGTFEGKSLLPPLGDPAKISPRPELKGFPLYKGLPPTERG